MNAYIHVDHCLIDLSYNEICFPGWVLFERHIAARLFTYIEKLVLKTTVCIFLLMKLI